MSEEVVFDLKSDATLEQRWNWILDKLPAIGKDSVNKQQGFKYRSVDTVLDYLNPLLAKAGVEIFPTKQVAEREVRQTKSGGYLNVCHITVNWEIVDVNGGFRYCQTIGEGTDAGDKATSKAQTMAFKYLLWPSLAIAENEDPDGEVVEESGPNPVVDKFQNMTPPREPDPNEVTQKQINKIRIELNKLGMSEGSDMIKAFKESNPGDAWPELGLNGLTKDQASNLIDWLVKTGW